MNEADKNNVPIVIRILVSLAKEVNAATLSLPRPDGSEITYYFDTPGSKSFPLVVILQGSDCASKYKSHNGYMPAVKRYNIALLTVEKYGLKESSSACPMEYLKNNTIRQRLLDYIAVLAAIKKNVPEWNGHVAWVGGSEGGVVASLVSQLTPATTATVLLASGGGMTMAEEMSLLLKKHGEICEVKSQSKLEALFKRIEKKPTYLKHWCGNTNTYKWWESILKLKPLSVLETMDTPIYIAHGTSDQAVPVESADLIKGRFESLGRSNLTYIRYEGLDHHWQNANGTSLADGVIDSAMYWLVRHLPETTP